MLSCYTPFLLAIVRQRETDLVTAQSSSLKPTNVVDSSDLEGDKHRGSGSADDGSDAGMNGVNEESHGDGAGHDGREGAGVARRFASSCPPALCAEALWALSEYAVLSPGFAAAELLPLAQRRAEDTYESLQVVPFLSYTAGKCR